MVKPAIAYQYDVYAVCDECHTSITCFASRLERLTVEVLTRICQYSQLALTPIGSRFVLLFTGFRAHLGPLWLTH